jgi:NADH-quinone oxidoreductase subunit C
MIDDVASAAAAVPTRLEGLRSAMLLALPGQLQAVPNTCRELTYEVAADALLPAATALRDGVGLKFEMCMDVCGVDYLEHGRAEWKTQDATSSGFSRGVARAHPSEDSVPAGRRFAVVYRSISGCACACFAPTTPSPWWIR